MKLEQPQGSLLRRHVDARECSFLSLARPGLCSASGSTSKQQVSKECQAPDCQQLSSNAVWDVRRG